MDEVRAKQEAEKPWSLEEAKRHRDASIGLPGDDVNWDRYEKATRRLLDLGEEPESMMRVLPQEAPLPSKANEVVEAKPMPMWSWVTSVAGLFGMIYMTVFGEIEPTLTIFFSAMIGHYAMFQGERAAMLAEKAKDVAPMALYVVLLVGVGFGIHTVDNDASVRAERVREAYMASCEHMNVLRQRSNEYRRILVRATGENYSRLPLAKC
jgi:hypothetical protein